jgi:malate dehydrogenase (oxaloacetate-decarboxylating)
MPRLRPGARAKLQWLLMAQVSPTASHSFTMRVRIVNKPGKLASVVNAIAALKGDPGAIDVVSASRDFKVRDITVSARDDDHAQLLIEAVRGLKGIEVVHVSDRVFLMHLGGKIRVQNKIPLTTRDALSMAYTPGVARVCQAIAADKGLAHTLTIKHNSVAIVSDGSAVLGLGNIGPEAAMPVMEGKAMLFKEFADIDAYPICLQTQDPDEIVSAVRWISTGFGGINLEDISAPRCFDIEQRLKIELPIPVFHDDQHGTAIVVLAATLNALKIVKKKLAELRVVIAGAGAAGMACAKILRSGGARDIVVCDRHGAISRRRLPDLEPGKAWLAEHTNPRGLHGSIADALKGANLFIGVSGPGVVRRGEVKRMARDAIVFALANPTPEIMPEDAAPYARIIATGRSDYANQINNVLAFPGMFRGALDARARDINEPMKLAAAKAIAACIEPDELGEEYIVPGVFNKQVARRVARAVEAAAHESGVARRKVRGGVVGV